MIAIERKTNSEGKSDILTFYFCATALVAFLLFCAAWYRTEQMFAASSARVEAIAKHANAENDLDRKAIAALFAASKDRETSTNNATAQVQKVMLANQAKLIEAMTRLTQMQAELIEKLDKASTRKSEDRQ